MNMVATKVPHIERASTGRRARIGEALSLMWHSKFNLLRSSIVGTPPDAIILGALIVQGIRVDPQLFVEQASTVYTFIFGLLFATLLMIPVDLMIGRTAFRTISFIPKAVLAPAIGVLIMIGSFAFEQNPIHVVTMVALGAFGWVVLKFGFEASPIVLGLILCPVADRALFKDT